MVNSDSVSKATLDEAEIIRRVLDGENTFFELLVRRNNQMLYRVIRSYLKNEEDIRDAMQNTYVKAYCKLYQFNGSAAFSTWLIKIGINEALQRLNHKRKFSFLSEENNFENTDSVLDMQSNPERKFIRDESTRIFEQAIDALPEKYRVVYVLREVEELSNGEVAEALQLSEANVKVRHHRAKAILKENLYRVSLSDQVFGFGHKRCDELTQAVMAEISCLK